MAANAYQAFLLDSDQAARRAELEQFFGPNAHKFMAVYDTLQADAAAGGKPKYRLFGGGFSVPAFLFGPVWFLYRKMWVIAGVVVAAMIAISRIPGASRAGLPIGIALGLMAYRVYVQHVIGALARVRRPDGTIDPQEIARAGGVSRTAGWISGVIYGLLILISIVSIIVLVQAGEPIPR